VSACFIARYMLVTSPECSRRCLPPFPLLYAKGHHRRGCNVRVRCPLHVRAHAVPLDKGCVEHDADARCNMYRTRALGWRSSREILICLRSLALEAIVVRTQVRARDLSLRTEEARTSGSIPRKTCHAGVAFRFVASHTAMRSSLPHGIDHCT